MVPAALKEPGGSCTDMVPVALKEPGGSCTDMVPDALREPGGSCWAGRHRQNGTFTGSRLQKLNITLEKKVAGFWVKVPCVEELGSCHYRDACDVLNQLIPPGQDCPEPLHTYGLPCRCPFKDGSYSLPQTQFYLPHMDLPHWLTNGDYRVQGVLGKDGKELGCLKLFLSVHSA